MSRLKEQYQNEIVDALTKKFGYKNIMEVPKLDKVVINMGVGEAKDNAKLLDSAIADMEKITGQKAVICRAKKSVANFKLREGMAIGCKVTLRGEKMYEFVDRLINLALPRVRDFRGVNPNAFDGSGLRRSQICLSFIRSNHILHGYPQYFHSYNDWSEYYTPYLLLPGSSQNGEGQFYG